MLATLTKNIANNARRVAVRHISTTSVVNRDSGVIKWFDVIKGYGFITPDAGEKDLFLHATGFENQYTRAIDFTADMPCEFDVETTDRGPVAKNVTGPDGSNFPEKD